MTLKNRRNLLATATATANANAHRHQREAAVDALERTQSLAGDQGARSANGVTRRDARAVEVDRGRAWTEVVADGAGLGGKGFLDTTVAFVPALASRRR